MAFFKARGRLGWWKVFGSSSRCGDGGGEQQFQNKSLPMLSISRRIDTYEFVIILDSELPTTDSYRPLCRAFFSEIRLDSNFAVFPALTELFRDKIGHYFFTSRSCLGIRRAA